MRFSSFTPLLAGVAAAGSIPSVLAWGAAGHEIVATIAQIYLHPSVLPTICSILDYTSPNPDEPQCHLAPIATWADRVRGLPQYRWSGVYHYINAVDDYPGETCEFPGPRGWQGKPGANVLGGIHNYTYVLEDYEGANEEERMHANEALKFLVHFIGDMHNPLHLAGRDKGGNGVKVLFDKRTTNLHSVWDSLFIAQRLRTIPSNYTRPIPYPQVEYVLRGTIYDPYVRRLMYEGLLGKWEHEIYDWLQCPAAESAPLSGWGRILSGWNTVLSWFSTQPIEEADDSVICPYFWSQDLHKLNCDIVWPKALDEPPYSKHIHDPYNLAPAYPAADAQAEQFVISGDFAAEAGPEANAPRVRYLELETPEYAGVIRERWIMEKLLAMAGIRLAGVLNYLFAEEEAKGLYLYKGF